MIKLWKRGPSWAIAKPGTSSGWRNCAWREVMHLFWVVTSANKCSVGHQGEEGKEKICMFALLPRQDRGVASGIILLALWWCRAFVSGKKNNSGLIIEGQLESRVSHSEGSPCLALSMSCRGIADKMNRRFVRRERVNSRYGVLQTGVGSSLVCVSDQAPWTGIGGAVSAHGVNSGRPV